MSEWSVEALAFFKARAIDPDVAYEAGVRQNGSGLVYPHGRTRRFDGHSMNQAGEKPRAWPIPNREAFKSGSVLITEGETDALAAASALADGPEAGLPILAVPGIQAIKPESLSLGLTRCGVREALVAYDADEPGRRAAARLAGALDSAGIKAMNAAPPKDDLSAWLASMNGSRGSALVDLLSGAQPFRTGPPSYADVGVAEIRYLWRERIPLRKLSVLAGASGAGKSTLTCSIAAEVARSEPVLIANVEDEPEELRPRFGNLDVETLRRLHPFDFKLAATKPAKLREAVQQAGVRLVVIDHYKAFAIAMRADPIRDAFRALEPLVDLARDYDCAVLLVCHPLVFDENKKGLDRIPHGLRETARSVLMLSDDTELLNIKNSYRRCQPAISYRFDGSRLVEPNLPAASEVEAKAQELGLTMADD